MAATSSSLSPTIKAIECRFAVHCPSKEPGKDFHLIKERVHYTDGTSKPNVKFKYNFKRDWYATQKGRRTYKDFKEWEDKDALVRYECTQSDLVGQVAKVINGFHRERDTLRDLCQSPYIFGVDISSTSIIKHAYQAQYPDTITAYSNAVFDTEFDMIRNTDQTMMATVSFKNKVITAVQAQFVEGHVDPIKRIKELAMYYIGDTIKARNIELEIVIVPTEIDVFKVTIAKGHEWQPDFMSVWNLEYDMDRLIEACDRAGLDPKDLLSDPTVPVEHRRFKFKKGAAKKVMASGRILNFKPSQRWHSVEVPSSFYWIDAMGTYRQVRTGNPEEPSYSLDAILKKHLNITKLKFAEADHVTGAEWHRFMQKHYPLEYVVYNIFDCVSMEMLDEKILDLQIQMPMFAGCTDFANFNSLPRKSMNELHWFCDARGKVPGSTASEMAVELDSDTLGITEWISMLPSHLIADNGLCLIQENVNLRTNIRGFVAD